MAYYKLANADTNPDSMFHAYEGANNCCGDTVATETTYTHSAVNLGSNNIEGINIDGTEYTFTTPATTEALLVAGINEAFGEANYEEIKGVSVSVTGGDSAAVATIITTATLTELVGSSSNVTLTEA